MNYTEEVLYKSKLTGFYYHKKLDAEKAGLCTCGSVIDKKGWAYCNDCLKFRKEEKDKAFRTQFMKRESKDWDESVVMVWDENTDEWFYDQQMAEDYYGESEELNIKDAMFIEGVPEYLRSIDSDIYEDDIHENFEFSEEIMAALHTLNEIAGKTIGSYTQGKFRVSLIS